MQAFTELTRLAVARQGLAVGPEKVPAEKPSTSAAAAAGRPQPFDTQVKIITIGDSGVCVNAAAQSAVPMFFGAFARCG